MKKVLLIAAIAVFGFTANAQDISVGALGGLSISSAKTEGGGLSASESETGFHIGAFAGFGLSDEFSIQPELTYTMSGDVSIFGVNAIAKYYVADEFNIQAGPQLGFVGGDFADAMEALVGDDWNGMNIQLAAGVGYDFTDQLFAQARYGFQLNNHYSGDADLDVKINSITLSVGYKFM